MKNGTNRMIYVLVGLFPVLFLAAAMPLFAQNTPATVPPQVAYQGSATNILFNARIGFQFGLKTKEFFENYRYALGVKNPDFAPPFTLGTALKVDLGTWRLGIDGEYFNANIDELQDVAVRNLPDTTVRGSRKLSESVSLRLIPLLLTAEFIPIQAQFRTYIGMGAGIGMARMTWTEKVTSTVANDSRTGGSLVDDSKTVPALRLYGGVQLGYDRMRSGSSHFGSLIIEARYTYMPYTVAAFRKIAGQFSAPLPSWNNEFTIGASALSLQIGVQFNLSRLR